MKKYCAFSVITLLSSSLAFAQAQASVSGQWRGITHSPDSGKEIQFEVKITETNGSWTFFPSGRKANLTCLGRELPLTVKALAQGQWMLRVDGSGVISGCPSFAITLEQTDEHSLAGVFADGRKVAMKKLGV